MNTGCINLLIGLEKYGAEPERLYLIDAGGKVRYYGWASLHFFDIGEFEETAEACVREIV